MNINDIIILKMELENLKMDVNCLLSFTSVEIAEKF